MALPVFEVTKDELAMNDNLEAGLDEKWMTTAKELLNENPDEREKLVADFKTAIESDRELMDFIENRSENYLTESALVKFLRSGAWKIPDSLTVLREYTALGKNYTAILKCALPSKLDCVWEKQLSTVSQYRDRFGRRIYIFRLGKWDPDTVSVNEFYASAYVLFELMAREEKTQIAGVTCVADITGLGFKHIRNLGIEQIRCIASFLTGSFPIWFRRIHVVHHPRIFNVLYNMIKPFLIDRVRDNIVFHGSSFTELLKEVPQCALPSYLGGAGELDNTHAVAVAKNLDHYYQDNITHLITQLQKGI